MSLETYTGFIPSLVDTNPTNSDPKSQGAAHIRGTKKTLAVTFSGFTEPDVAVTVKASALNKAAQGDGNHFVPSGAVMAFGMAAIPTGWLQCNGAAISRTTYAALFAQIGTTYGIGDGSTTFNVPNLLGAFVRGWNSTAGGQDPSRALGSSQAAGNAPHTHTAASSVVNHNHTATTSTDPGHTHSTTLKRELGSRGSNAFFGDEQMDGVEAITSSAAGAHAHTLTTDTNAHAHTVTVDSQGAEGRPYNLALNYCIKT